MIKVRENQIKAKIQIPVKFLKIMKKIKLKNYLEIQKKKKKIIKIHQKEHKQRENIK